MPDRPLVVLGDLSALVAGALGRRLQDAFERSVRIPIGQPGTRWHSQLRRRRRRWGLAYLARSKLLLLLHPRRVEIPPVLGHGFRDVFPTVRRLHHVSALALMYSTEGLQDAFERSVRIP